jgi:glycosyltransferase involved in cell wall biosynthesis
MKISGFTIVRNAIKFHYPVLASIQSILPICDEFIINVGDSQDGTLELMKSIQSPKIRIIETVWDMNKGPTVLSEQTNIALKECKGDWAFYLQTDEVIHEKDLPKLKSCMLKNLDNPSVDALRFKWLHFYGSYWRYRIDAGWYQKQDRIVRNNGTIESYGDAFAFRRIDGKPLHSEPTGAFLYHYGWVQSSQVMAQRRHNAQQIGFIEKAEGIRDNKYEYGDLNRFPVYFGTHPATMNEETQSHSLSQEDLKNIQQKYWWHPLRWLKLRYKTFKRVKHKIE